MSWPFGWFSSDTVKRGQPLPTKIITDAKNVTDLKLVYNPNKLYLSFDCRINGKSYRMSFYEPFKPHAARREIKMYSYVNEFTCGTFKPSDNNQEEEQLKPCGHYYTYGSIDIKQKKSVDAYYIAIENSELSKSYKNQCLEFHQRVLAKTSESYYVLVQEWDTTYVSMLEYVQRDNTKAFKSYELKRLWFQLLMIIYSMRYQFGFLHRDLAEQNILLIPSQKKGHIEYNVGGVLYQVPIEKGDYIPYIMGLYESRLYKPEQEIDDKDNDLIFRPLHYFINTDSIAITLHFEYMPVENIPRTRLENGESQDIYALGNIFLSMLAYKRFKGFEYKEEDKVDGSTIPSFITYGKQRVLDQIGFSTNVVPEQIAEYIIRAGLIRKALFPRSKEFLFDQNTNTEFKYIYQYWQNQTEKNTKYQTYKNYDGLLNICNDRIQLKGRRVLSCLLGYTEAFRLNYRSNKGWGLFNVINMSYFEEYFDRQDDNLVRQQYPLEHGPLVHRPPSSNPNPNLTLKKHRKIQLKPIVRGTFYMDGVFPKDMQRFFINKGYIETESKSEAEYVLFKLHNFKSVEDATLKFRDRWYYNTHFDTYVQKVLLFYYIEKETEPQLDQIENNRVYFLKYHNNKLSFKGVVPKILPVKREQKKRTEENRRRISQQRQRKEEENRRMLQFERQRKEEENRRILQQRQREERQRKEEENRRMLRFERQRKEEENRRILQERQREERQRKERQRKERQREERQRKEEENRRILQQRQREERQRKERQREERQRKEEENRRMLQQRQRKEERQRREQQRQREKKFLTDKQINSIIDTALRRIEKTREKSERILPYLRDRRDIKAKNDELFGDIRLWQNDWLNVKEYFKNTHVDELNAGFINFIDEPKNDENNPPEDPFYTQNTKFSDIKRDGWTPITWLLALLNGDTGRRTLVIDLDNPNGQIPKYNLNEILLPLEEIGLHLGVFKRVNNNKWVISDAWTNDPTHKDTKNEVKTYVPIKESLGEDDWEQFQNYGTAYAHFLTLLHIVMKPVRYVDAKGNKSLKRKMRKNVKMKDYEERIPLTEDEKTLFRNAARQILLFNANTGSYRSNDDMEIYTSNA